jgi:hypothetical protein
MDKRELVDERLAEMDVSALTADGFDDAIIGIASERVVYSRTKCIEILMKRDGMDYLEAMEYFDFNVEGAYMGEKTPIWVDDEFLNE